SHDATRQGNYCTAEPTRRRTDRGAIDHAMHHVGARHAYEPQAHKHQTTYQAGPDKTALQEQPLERYVMPLRAVQLEQAKISAQDGGNSGHMMAPGCGVAEEPRQ